MIKGFTLIEMLIVLMIAVILTVIVIGSFSILRENQELNRTVENVVLSINLARSKTLSSEDFSQYGVHFATTSITIFKGTSFSESGPDNIRIDLSPHIEISQISLNGGSNVIFQKLSGKTDNYGNIILKAKSNPSKTKTINIKSTGIANVL